MQGDTETEREERLHVQVRLRSADRAGTARVQGGLIGRRAEHVAAEASFFAHHGVGRIGRRRERVAGQGHGMRVRRHFSDREGVRLLTARLTEGMPGTYVNRDARAQVRQGKIDPAVTAKSGAQQREQRLILVDR